MRRRPSTTSRSSRESKPGTELTCATRARTVGNGAENTNPSPMPVSTRIIISCAPVCVGGINSVKNVLHAVRARRSCDGCERCRAYGVPNASGSEGAAVTTALAFTDVFGNGMLPGDAGTGRYTVSVSASQNCFIAITGKTSTG